MNKTHSYINTIIKLGFSKVLYVIWYRFSIKTGFRKWFFQAKDFKFTGDFFKAGELCSDYPDSWNQALLADADNILSGRIRYFGYHWKHTGNPPQWFENVFNKSIYPESRLHWTKLPDFHPVAGDIKIIWEPSRFEWLVTLARAYAVTGEIKYLTTINDWLKDWSINNPLNIGPNWKCGQEASIRIFNLLNASLILKNNNCPTENLQEIIYSHLERINGNILYAISQDNNHGTSEAAGLFIGGNWLERINNDKFPRAKHFSKRGRYWLENRVGKLIDDEGSFSQHSVTYHRVLLDTLCFAEFWRLELKTTPFSDEFYHKAKSAACWLKLFTDELSGNAPNLGGNDGAMILNTHSCGYRDFRPTLNLAFTIFSNVSTGNDNCSKEVKYWFDLPSRSVYEDTQDRASTVLKGGYTIIKIKTSWALIRWPYFRFRPSHNDVMHFDLWYKGKNIICDAGTYSYNQKGDVNQSDYSSVHFHNTVVFDGNEQMPRLSRFLLGNWIKTGGIDSSVGNYNGVQKWVGWYNGSDNNRHERTVSTRASEWIIEDTLKGCFREAVIGFNINDGTYNLRADRLDTSFGVIIFSTDMKAKLKEIFVSDYYWEKHKITRLELKVNQPGTFITKITLLN